jgi:hypothetical protein
MKKKETKKRTTKPRKKTENRKSSSRRLFVCGRAFSSVFLLFAKKYQKSGSTDNAFSSFSFFCFDLKFIHFIDYDFT